MKLIKSWVEVEKFEDHDALTFYYIYENDGGERFMMITSPLRTSETSLHKETETWHRGNEFRYGNIIASNRAYLQFDQHDKFFEVYSIGGLVDKVTLLHENLDKIESERVKKEKLIKELEKVYDKYFINGGFNDEG